MKNKSITNYPLIDILKLFFALCVVAVHVWFLYDFKVGYYLYTMLYRLAVPFFFITSGFFLAKKVIKSDKKSAFIEFFKKNIFYYFLLSSLSFLINMVKGNNFSISNILMHTYQFLKGRAWGISWFLGALIVSAFILYFINDKEKLKISIKIALALFLMGLLFNTYNFILINHGYVDVYNFFVSTFVNNSNFLFIGFLFVSVGYYIGLYGENIINKSKYLYYVLLITGIILLLFEVNYIKPHIGVIINYEYYISHLLIIPSILLIGLKSDLNQKIRFNTKLIRNLSICFFYLHMSVLELLLLFRSYKQYNVLYSNVWFYFIICGLTLLISLLYLKYKKKNKEDASIVSFGLYYISFVILIFSFVCLLNKVIWVDEACSISMLKHSLKDIIMLNINDVHPPLYYLGLKIFYSIVHGLFNGLNIIYISKIFSFIPLIILFIFGLKKVRTKYGNLVASLFLLFISGMPQLMQYFVEIRMYSWALCFTTIAFVYLFDVIDNNNKKSWILFTIFSLLSAYSHLYSCLCIVLMFSYILIYSLCCKKYDLLKKWFKYGIITIILYLPWIIVILNQMKNVSGGFWIPPITFNDIKGYIYFIFKADTQHPETTNILFYGSLLIILFLFVKYLINKEIKNNDKITNIFGLFLPFLIIIIGVVVSLIITPLFISRYIVPTLGCLWFAVVIMLANYYKDHKFGVLFILVFAIISVANINTFTRHEIGLEELRSYLETYQKKITKNDIVVSDYTHIQLTDTVFLPDNTIYCFKCYNSKMINELFVNVKDNITIDDIVNYLNQGKKVYFIATNKYDEYNDLFKKNKIKYTMSDKYYLDWYQMNIYELKY